MACVQVGFEAETVCIFLVPMCCDPASHGAGMAYGTAWGDQAGAWGHGDGYAVEARGGAGLVSAVHWGAFDAGWRLVRMACCRIARAGGARWEWLTDLRNYRTYNILYSDYA
ncbi:hypothetical protein AA0616_0997 [Komagataeibacter nataicola NRIC 0616]|nr:hypothetical protein AA0616_0997 [Komagataeibacter nataicola NRIC 0616]